MPDMAEGNGNKPHRGKWCPLGGTGLTLAALAVVAAGGWAWHRQPAFCATCHTPMRGYVDSYRGGDATLMVTPHASGETVLGCLDCHPTELRRDATVALHWVTGDYVFPLKQRDLGTNSFCLAAGCHDEKKIIKATKDYGGARGFNLHDPRHGRLSCQRCHLTHDQSVLACNQCHKLKLPKGWVAPAPNGTIAARRVQ